MNVYLVAYDIADDKRLKKTYKTMRGFGEHIQYSIFRCELSDANLVRMKLALTDVIQANEDQVLIFRLGPADGVFTEQVDALGLPYGHVVREAVIV